MKTDKNRETDWELKIEQQIEFFLKQKGKMTKNKEQNIWGSNQWKEKKKTTHTHTYIEREKKQKIPASVIE